MHSVKSSGCDYNANLHKVGKIKSGIYIYMCYMQNTCIMKSDAVMCRFKIPKFRNFGSHHSFTIVKTFGNFEVTIALVKNCYLYQILKVETAGQKLVRRWFRLTVWIDNQAQALAPILIVTQNHLLTYTNIHIYITAIYTL